MDGKPKITNKNIVSGDIDAGGDVNIGDKNIYTESQMSKRLRLFLFFFVPLLAIVGAYLWYQNQIAKQPLNLKVLIENQTPNQELSDPSGTLTLIYGGESNAKVAINKEAYFENIPPSFKHKSFHLQYKAAGFIPVDTIFGYTESIVIPVQRNDELGLLKGYIYEEGTEPLKGIEGVRVSIDCCSSLTDASGQFILKIPFQDQRKKQQMKLFKKGFQQRNYLENVGRNIATYMVRSTE